MKKLRKYLGFVMAALMAFALTPMSAFADEAEGSIKIDNAVKGQEYTLYQILELESYNAEKNAYSYKAAEGWLPFLESQKDVIKIENGYVSWIGAEGDDSAQIVAFAKAALDFAGKNGIKATATKTAEGESVVFENLPLGYYLLDSTLGTVCSLDTNAPKVTIKEKNPEPTVDKQVQENSDKSWGETNDANIGDTVNFKSTISVNERDSPSAIVYRDKMSAGLTFSGTVEVKMGETAVAPENYTLVKESDEELDEGVTFEVRFTEAFCNGLKANDKIEILYSAVLNENAKVGSKEGNPNEAQLKYGEKGGSETLWDKTITYTWEVNVFKFTGNDQGLANAVFELTKADDDSTPVKVVPVEGKANTYRVDAAGTNVITTADGGKFKIEGLDAGAYKLTETVAPDGYNKLANPIEFTIGDKGVVSGTTNIGDVPTIKVENKTGLELPSTGGIGTTLFYVGGAILIIGCVAFLITRRRAGSAK